MKDFSGGKVPDLTHTKMLLAHLDGKQLSPEKTNWNRLLDEVILLAAKKLKDPKAVKQLVIVNCVTWKKQDQGYRYLKRPVCRCRARMRSLRGRLSRTFSTTSKGACRGRLHVA